MPRDVLLRTFERLRSLSGAAMDLVWPPVCPACKTGLVPGDPETLCTECNAELYLIQGRSCRRCAMPLGPFEQDNGGRFCVDCGGKSLIFRRAHCAGLYEGPLAETIKAFKYTPRARCAHLANYLSGLLAARLMQPDCTLDVSSVDIVVPVPSHRSRRRERDFDSTAEIARHLAGRLSLPLELRALEKVRATRQQMGLTRSARIDNVKGCFRVRRPKRLEAKTVLLVDDVLTTCATAEECARTLKASGVRETRVAAVARAVEGRSVQ